MNIKSIKFRLTFWYVSAFVIFSALLAIGFFILTKYVLYINTDSALTSHSEKVVEVLTRQECCMYQEIARQSFLQEFSGIPGMLVVVLNNDGNTISSSLKTDLPGNITEEMFQKVLNTKEPFFIDKTVGELPLRFRATPVIKNGTLLGVVLMAHPIEIVQKSLQSLLVTLGIIYVVLVIPTIIGGYLLAKGAISPLREITDKLKRVSSENLTERVKKPNTGDEIEELAETFNTMLGRISEAFERERMFIGDLAHELKTPLATLRSGVEITLSKKRTSTEYKSALTDSLVDINNISSTLKNILDLAWTRSDNARGKAEKVDLSGMSKELKEILEKLTLTKNLKIVSNIENNIEVLGQEDKLMRAFLNIIDNAVKFTPANGTITLLLRKEGGSAIFSVKDTGIGISKKDLPNVFNRFYRGTGTEKTLGSGLGLSIAQALVNAHQGKIVVNSKPGNGTSVSVKLPLAKISS
ncbi:MAG TPA: ATP-binding protein [Patescibacteria group bacterium]|nr:ATP-binding protein [Patescibacteria group bacterium]